MNASAVRDRLKCTFSPVQILLAPSGTISELMGEIRVIRGLVGLDGSAGTSNRG